MDSLRITTVAAVALLVSFVIVGALYLFSIVYDVAVRHEPSAVPESITPVFAPESLIWRESASSAPWEARDSGEAFVFQNKLWFIGGLNGNANVLGGGKVEYWKAPHFNDIWNTEDGLVWDRITSSSQWTPRRSMSVALFRNRLWMLGGWSPISGYTNDIWVSDDGISWEQTLAHADWPAREGQTLEIFQNKLWLIGGVNYDERQTKNDVWYSEDGTNWIEVKNIPWKSRWDHATAVFDGKLFLAGGMNLKGDTFNDIWLSEDGLIWTLVTDSAPWEKRQGHTMEVYKDRLWIIGRFNDEQNGGENDVWFSEDGIGWLKTTSNPQWAGREDFFSAVFKDKIWIFGGMDTNWQWRNDVWVSK